MQSDRMARRKTMAPLSTYTVKGRKDLEQRFFDAAYTNNVVELKNCLAKRVNPNSTNKFFETPLQIAAEKGDTVVGKHLMKCPGIDLNLPSIHGNTPLILTCMFNRKNFALMLLQRGADPNMPDRIGRTPLHVCITSGASDIVFHLLRYKAQINVLDAFDRTPLSMCLLDHHNFFIAKFLLKRGADVHDFESKRILHVFFECVLQCRFKEHIDYVLLLLDHGLDVNLIDAKTGRNCLHFVGLTGFLPLGLILVDRGADTDLVDTSGRTPAMVARDHQNEFVADFFVKRYRPPNLVLLMPFLKRWKRKPLAVTIVEPDDSASSDNA